MNLKALLSTAAFLSCGHSKGTHNVAWCSRGLAKWSRAVSSIRLSLCGLIGEEGQKGICALTNLLRHQMVLTWGRELV